MFLVSLLNKNQIDHRYLHHKWNVKKMFHFLQKCKGWGFKKTNECKCDIKNKKRHPKIIYLNYDL